MNDEWELFTCIRPLLEIAEKYLLRLFLVIVFMKPSAYFMYHQINIQKFLEIYEIVEVNLHPFITTMLSCVWRCRWGEDVVAWPPQTPHPLSGCHTLPGHRNE